jgi:hypothetical protein
MASVDEHQLCAMHLVRSMGCMTDEGKSVIGALGDECWCCDFRERERLKVGFV